MHIPAVAKDYEGIAKKTTSGINWTGKVTSLDKRLIEPLLIKKPSTFFVNSMSDLFHPNVPFEFIAKVFAIMALTPQHTYQILTKQSARMVAYFKKYENGMMDDHELESFALDYFNQIHSFEPVKEIGDVYGDLLPHIKDAGWYWEKTYTEFGKENNLMFDTRGPLKNVWLGVSVENQEYANLRIPDLLDTPAAVHFLSCEPLLGKIDLRFIPAPDCDKAGASRIWPFTGQRTDMARPCHDTVGKIDWVIVGGESGTSKNVNPMHPDWARSVRDQCKEVGVPFFFKQWGKYLPQCQADGVDTDGYKLVQFPSPHNPGKMNSYYNMGKHNAGSKLDGLEYKEFQVC